MATLSLARRALMAELVRERSGAIPRRPAGADPLSAAQQRMWFLDQYEPAQPVYNVYVAVRLVGALDVDALSRAIDTVVERHEILRTTYALSDGAVTPVVQPPSPRPLPVVDVVDEVAAAGEQARLPFDLATGPLLRTLLLRKAEHDHVLVLTLHHIAADGWSLGVLVTEITALYRAFTSDQPNPLPPLRVQYADYAHWHRAQADGPTADRQLAYWRERLVGAPALLVLPTDRPRPVRRSGIGRRQRFIVGRDLVAALESVARSERVTLFMTLLAALNVVLARYSGQADVCVGTPIANRTRPELENLIGYFANTLVLRTDLSGDPTFRDLLGRVREATVGAYDHQDVPFERLVDDLAPDRDPSRTPLFQVLLVLQNAPMPTPATPDVVVSDVEMHNGTAKFDLTLMVYDQDGELTVTVEYATDLFDDTTITRFFGHLRNTMTALTADLDRPVWTFEQTGADERALIASWNDTDAPLDTSLLVHHRIDAQAARTPDAVAVETDDGSVTYGDLVRRANGLAHRLRAAGVGPESPVGVLLDRSADQIVALLAVLKAGGGYLPLEPEYPAERVAYLLRDTGARVLVSERHVASVVRVDPKADPADTAPAADVTGPSLAYVIYTSGSTGAPKGVVGTHEGMLNRLTWLCDTYGFDAADRPLFKTPFSVDTSIEEIFAPLLVGGCVVVARPDAHRDPAYLVDAVIRHGATRLRFVPSLLGPFLAEPGVRECGSLRQVFSGGERLPRVLERRALDVLGPILHNVYGPTEASIDVTAWQCRADDDLAMVPIGTPMANARVHLLDGHLRPVPVGVPGELYIGGVCVGRGYLGKPGLTAERFVPDPFAEGRRLYRTGDRARHLPDGRIEYLDRVDRQVQVRGHRVEPGEVEAALTRCAGVDDAAVATVPDRDGMPRLVAYLVGGTTITRVRAELRDRVPDHLVPAVFVFVPALPLTPNGKLDRRALPVPDDTRPEVGDFVPPTGPRETALAAIWRDVLGLERVGAEDNFFALGGDSIRTIRVVSMARDEGIGLSVRDLFEHQTVRGLAAAGDTAAAPSTRTAPFDLVHEETPPGIEDAYPLSATQAGMVFDRELEGDPATHHLVLSFHLRGRFDRDALVDALVWAAGRHPALRTSFSLADYSRPVQLVHRTATVPFTVDDLTGAADQDGRIAEWVERERGRPFDLAEPPLVRAHVHLRGPDAFQFTLSSLALVLDGWSVASLLTELFEAYASRRDGEPWPDAPAPASTYRDFVACELADAAGEPAEVTSTPLPPPWGEPGPGLVDVPLREGISAELRRLAEQAGVPLKSVLLAAHLRVLSLVTGRADVATGLVTNGRLEETDGDRVLGQFLTVLPVAARMAHGSWESLARDAFAAERTGLAARHHPTVRAGTRFETVFNFVHFHVYGQLDGVDLVDSAGFDGTNFPLFTEFSIHPVSGAVRLRLQHKPGRLGAEQIADIARHYATVLAVMVDEPTSRHDRLPLPVPKTPAVVEPTFSGRTIPELFAARAASRPDAVALVSGDLRMTYRELDECSNALASRLRAAGVRPETVVGLVLRRSVETVVGMLGVLKAGGVYAVVDPEPAARRAELLTAARADVVVTTGDVAMDGPVVRVDLSARAEATACPSDPDQLACLVFTSGTTGRPKAVGLPHRQIVNRLAWSWRAHPFEPDEVGCLKTPSGFVDSLWEVFGTLLAGVPSVVVAEDDARDPYRLTALLAEHWVSRVLLVPSLLRMMLDAHPNLAERLPRLVLWQTSGEPLPDDLRRAFAARLPSARLVNVYGATEAWDATSADVTHGAGIVPIGQPLDGTRVHILGPALRRAPVGWPGELYVGGEGVARGYANDPATTAARFVPDPFRTGGRLYRTGDLARLLPDGRMELLGRADQQLKVRGVRVEPAEIEAVLRRHDAVREAVVVAGDSGLVAFYVGDADPDDLRGHARRRLAAAVTPSAFVALDVLPSTANGKVDRRALARLVPDRQAVVPAGSDTERTLVEIWAEVLRHNGIGVHDDFFAVGGDSLSATRIMARVRRVLDVELTVRDLFDAPTVAGLAALVEAGRTVADRATDGRNVLSYGQRGLWFLDQLAPGGVAYNERYALRLTGDLDVAALDRALREVVRRHEVLRTAIDVVDGEPVPRVVAVPDSVLEPSVDSVARPFDLTAGQLLRAAVARTGPNEWMAVLVMHHIACDAWSIRVLMRELTALYAAFTRGEPSPLPELDTQYADYARVQAARLGGRLETLVDHWRTRMASATVLDLAPGRERGRRPAAVAAATLPPEVCHAVKNLAANHRASLFMALLTGFAIVLRDRTAEDDIVVGTDVAGRDRADWEALIGFFVNQLPLRIDLTGDPTFGELLDRVREVTLDAYAHQELPYARMVDALRPNRAPAFQTKLVLQNVPDEDLRLPGLALEPIEQHRGTAQVDLNVRAAEAPDGLRLSAEYDADLFEAVTVSGLLAALTAVLDRGASAPDTRLSALRQAGHHDDRAGAARLSRARRRAATGRDKGEQ
ncbi:amino acid adenylation domain-containing protein [Actinophytocola xinjiangensis]|nr:non-ribosomal peptide synthetase [Actinophytocola xinjiangensis]